MFKPERLQVACSDRANQPVSFVWLLTENVTVFPGSYGLTNLLVCCLNSDFPIKAAYCKNGSLSKLTCVSSKK